MRRNAPRLIDPKNDAMRHTDHQLGIELPMEHGDRLSEVERQIADLNWQVQNLRSRLQVVEPFAFASPGILTTFNLKGSVTATNITGTTTVTNSNIGPLIAGMPYLVIAIAQMGMNAPAGQTIYAAVRIEAGGTTVDGTQTQITSGERDGMAIDFKTVVGTGASINIAGRARVTSGTGTVSDAISVGIAIPLGAMVAV
jgi:hypothetical protein